MAEDEGTREVEAEESELAITLDKGDDDSSEDGLAALKSQLEELRVQNARLAGRLDEQGRRPAAESKSKPREFTRAELQAQVDNGTISEDQRDEVLDRQRAERLKAEIRDEVRAEERDRRLRSEIQRYYDQHPQLTQDGSEMRTRAGQEYRRLVDLGFPDSLVTELAALQNSMGSANPPREKTRAARERHEEQAETGSGSPGTSRANSWEKGLSRRLIDHFRGDLGKGLYSGTDDPAFQKAVRIARGEDPRGVTKASREQRVH